MTHFDRWAPSYDDCALRPLYDAAHRAVVDILGSGSHRPHRILDIGCGSARMLRAVAALFPDACAVGVDLSLGMLHVAAQVGPGHFVCAAAEELAFADAAFDTVTSTISMRHWTDRRAAFSQIHRLLEPGGLLVIATIDERPSRRPRRSRPVLRDDLYAAGFVGCRTRQVAGFGPVPMITLVSARQAMHGTVRLRARRAVVAAVRWGRWTVPPPPTGPR